MSENGVVAKKGNAEKTEKTDDKRIGENGMVAKKGNAEKTEKTDDKRIGENEIGVKNGTRMERIGRMKTDWSR